MPPITFRMRLLTITAVSVMLASCSPNDNTPTTSNPDQGVAAPSDSTQTAAPASTSEEFARASDALMQRMLSRSPEWSIYAGNYEDADQVSIPDAARRADDLAFVEAELAGLANFDPETLPPEQRIDYTLLTNELQSMHWYVTEFRDWQWDPSNYNVAGPIGLLLNTPYAPEADRLRTVQARLQQVPEYYQAARSNINNPTREHTGLAIIQNQGTLNLIGSSLSDRVAASSLETAEKQQFEQVRQRAVETVTGFITEMQALAETLAEADEARPFRIGAELYEAKFAYDIQSGFTARELYDRAVEEKNRLHNDMDAITIELWHEYFPDQAMPDDRLERIGQLIDHLSDQHIERENFITEIERQIPLLTAFVNEHDLLDQDPTRPLVVRETPEYMRGGGAGASVSAPGPFNPTADTYYNVTPLDDYTDEQAASYLREYNQWVLQILNIHEAIPGHYTQLVHGNKSTGLIKSLLRNGAMIEGWAVYSERMMLEEGWADQEPEMWLMYGKWNLRVVTNAIMDYAVHVLGMTQDEAMDMMLREAFQEQTEAENKWRRITLSQVQLTSYFTGYAEIYDFRERRKAELGDDFDLKTFHNRFLGYGNAPVPAIIDMMEGAD
ncbi:DUF885 domain-containing protein [Pseudohongiella acticola]|jgi:uncharacterized protein (DUF885 family)|uniref:DUF885 domain-containing protein n=1 Tax=Pseudohongiella acticola TaxID=1524254 RepID=UPI0030EC6086